MNIHTAVVNTKNKKILKTGKMDRILESQKKCHTGKNEKITLVSLASGSLTEDNAAMHSAIAI